MSEINIEELKYPIGKFKKPEAITPVTVAAWIEDIAQLPAQLRASVADLTEEQLDTPYRPGGWTIRQVVHHLADSHMNSYVRYKLAMTEDNPTIKAYDQPAWGELYDSKTVPVELSLMLLEGLHIRWAIFLNSLKTEDWKRTFFHPESNRKFALDFNLAIYSWHGKHHLAHIENLKKRKGWS